MRSDPVQVPHKTGRTARGRSRRDTRAAARVSKPPTGREHEGVPATSAVTCFASVRPPSSGPMSPPNDRGAGFRPSGATEDTFLPSWTLPSHAIAENRARAVADDSDRLGKGISGSNGGQGARDARADRRPRAREPFARVANGGDLDRARRVAAGRSDVSVGAHSRRSLAAIEAARGTDVMAAVGASRTSRSSRRSLMGTIDLPIALQEGRGLALTFEGSLRPGRPTCAGCSRRGRLRSPLERHVGSPLPLEPMPDADAEAFGIRGGLDHGLVQRHARTT